MERSKKSPRIQLANTAYGCRYVLLRIKCQPLDLLLLHQLLNELLETQVLWQWEFVPSRFEVSSWYKQSWANEVGENEIGFQLQLKSS